MKIRSTTRKNLPGTIVRTAAATLGLLMCATVFTLAARADCGSFTGTGMGPGTGQKPMFAAPPQRPFLLPVAYRPASLTVADRDDDQAAIVACGRCNLCLKELRVCQTARWSIRRMSNGTATGRKS